MSSVPPALGHWFSPRISHTGSLLSLVNFDLLKRPKTKRFSYLVNSTSFYLTIIPTHSLNTSVLFHKANNVQGVPKPCTRAVIDFTCVAQQGLSERLY